MAKVNSWQEKEIRQIGEVITGTTPSTKKPEYYGDEYKLISPVDLDKGKYVTTAHRMLSALGLERCRVLPRDAVLVGCIGNVGKIGMVADERAATNQQINAVICNQEHDPEFIYYSLCYNRQRLQKAAVKTTVPILNKSNFGKFKIDVPSFPEQRRIARVLSTVQTAIGQQSRLIALTQELKRTLMHKLFTEGLRGEKQKMTEIGPVPEGWELLTLGELLLGTLYGLSVRGEQEGEYGILRMTNQLDGRISTKEMQFVNIGKDDFEKFRLRYGDILFNRTNSFELVGRTAIFDIEGDYVFASYLIRLKTDEKRLNPFFLNHFLNWDDSQRRLKSIASRAVSQSNISATRLKTFQVPVPLLDEQDEVIERIDMVVEKTNLLQQKKQLLEEVFRTLLHQLMTGQIRVNDIDLPESLAEMTYA